MACVGKPVHTEWEFIQSLHDRKDGDECRGPVVQLAFRPFRLSELERGLDTDADYALLWSGFVPHTAPTIGLTFALCVLHWMDIAGRLMWKATESHDDAMLTDASVLVQASCRLAGFDPKEISNLLRPTRADG